MKTIEVYAPNNILIFKVVVTDDAGTSKQKPANNNGHKRRNSNRNNGDTITDPQKKYLFRLMAEKGLAEEAALEEIKSIFNVEKLNDISKIDASKAIEQLLEEQSAGGGSNGSSV